MVRKPQKLQLVGNESIQHYLQNIIKSGIVPHAQLWVGSEHIGKTTFLTKHLKERGLDTATGVRWYPAEEFTMAVARAVITDAAETSLWGQSRAVVITQAEQLRPAVYNALLKLLEEPRTDVTIYLLASELDTIPTTVRSRCSIIWFQRVADQLLLDSFPAAAELIPFAQGLPGRCVQTKWYQQVQRWRDILQRPPVERLSAIGEQVAGDLVAIELVAHSQLQSQPLPTLRALQQIALAKQSLRYPVQTKFLMTNLLLNIYPIL